MKKPLIGVVPLWDSKMESYWMQPGYMEGIQNAGGIPIILPMTTDEDILKQLAEECDGFLFTGGQDIAPENYGEKALAECGEPYPERDQMEFWLFDHAVMGMDKSGFGICRGLQLFNVCLGGTLYQDLPTQWFGRGDINHKQLPPYHIPVHKNTIDVGTPLFSLLKTYSLAVNSYHHQAIKELAGRLKPMAVSEDGIVEAAYVPGRRFIWAVQWHPEFIPEDAYSRRLFSEFVNSCL